MPVETRVAATADAVVWRTVCAGPASDDTGPDEPERIGDAFELVFARQGGFRRATEYGEHVVDPTVAYLAVPGEEQLVTHSGDGGDSGRVYALSADLAPLHLAHNGPVVLSPEADLFERRVAAALRSDRGKRDTLAVEESVVRLCDLLGSGSDGERPRPSPAVDRARELLAHRFAESLSLVDVAGLVGYSPHHLSRTFARATGLTLTRYRRRLRVRAALACLERGADDLARLAADLGFADHSHLTSACKAEAGDAPSRLRALLASP